MIRLIEQPGHPTYLRSDLLADRGVPHAFSTRQGGVSEPPFDTLNLGNSSLPDAPQDDAANIAENHRRLAAAIGCDSHQRVWVRQIHGGDCVRAEPAQCGTKADALIGDDPGALLSVQTADCVPILLASADGRTVAAVHAGWPGLVAGVIGHAVAQFGDRVSALVAAIGPAISVEHFEVGEEVAAQFDDAHIVRRPGRKPHVDLPGVAAAQLVAAGLIESNIDRRSAQKLSTGSDWCSYRDSELFFSHRRDRGRTGRMAALIAPRLQGS